MHVFKMSLFLIIFCLLQEFLTWLSNTLFGSMYPRASFPRRTTVISLLHLLHKFYCDPENNSKYLKYVNVKFWIFKLLE